MRKLAKSCLYLGCFFLLWLPVQAQRGFTLDNPYIKSVRIPIEVFNNLILMEVTINNSFPLFFIIDTGVKTTLLTEPVILSILNMDYVTPVKVRGLGSGDLIQAQLARGIKMELPGGVTGQNMRMIVLPEGAVSYSAMFGRPVVGILGYDLFQNFVVEINYYRKYIRLTRPKDFKAPKQDQELPIMIKRSKPYIRGQVANLQGDTLDTWWLMDTGSSQSISLYHEGFALPSRLLNAFIGEGLSGSLHGQIGRLPIFRLGPYRFEELIASFPEQASLRWVTLSDDKYANLGAGILSRFTLTFDYNRYRIYLRRNPSFKKSFEYNTSGLETLAQGVGFKEHYISYVRPDSPAEAAGVQVGDELLSVNGADITFMEVGEIHARLNRKAGRKLCLRLRREGEKFKRCFYLESGI